MPGYSPAVASWARAATEMNTPWRYMTMMIPMSEASGSSTEAHEQAVEDNDLPREGTSPRFNHVRHPGNPAAVQHQERTWLQFKKHMPHTEEFHLPYRSQVQLAQRRKTMAPPHSQTPGPTPQSDWPRLASCKVLFFAFSDPWLFGEPGDRMNSQFAYSAIVKTGQAEWPSASLSWR